MRRLFAAAALALAPAAVLAQAPACTVPQSLPRPAPELPSAEQPARDLPTASYTLALIWGPEACWRPKPARPGDLSCTTRANRTRFTLHGLWPDGTEPGKWPQYCHPVRLLGDAEIRAGLCATPSVQLLQHEWAKHGSCTGETPAAYFASADRLFASLRFPAMAALARRRDLTVGQFAQAFAAANPGMTPQTIRLNVNRAGWLEEVWLCLDRARRFATCSASQGEMDASKPVKIAAPR